MSNEQHEKLLDILASYCCVEHTADEAIEAVKKAIGWYELRDACVQCHKAINSSLKMYLEDDWISNNPDTFTRQLDQAAEQALAAFNKAMGA